MLGSFYLDTKETSINKTNIVTALKELTFLWGKWILPKQHTDEYKSTYFALKEKERDCLEMIKEVSNSVCVYVKGSPSKEGTWNMRPKEKSSQSLLLFSYPASITILL